MFYFLTRFNTVVFRIISIPLKFCYFRPPDHLISMGMTKSALNFRCQCTQQKLQSICAVLTFDPQLKKILTHTCDRVAMLQLAICKFLAGDFLSTYLMRVFIVYIDVFLLFVSVLNHLYPISIYIVYISVLLVVFHMMNEG